MGFLQIGLPGLQTLAGWAEPGLPRINARLAAEIQEGKAAWTDFFYGTLEPGDDLPAFHPMKKRVRLHSISQAKAVASIPEGMDTLPAGTVVNVQLLP
jgi:molybdopterin biosynthesis enzyme